jgi:predicted nucleic acid-binding protein
MYLLDTNFISELHREKPDPAAVTWSGHVNPNDAYVSAANINSKELKSFEITVPPLDLQHLFVTRVGNLMRIRERHTATGIIAERTSAAIQSLLLR